MASNNTSEDDFTVVNAWKDAHIFDDYKKLYSAHSSDPDTYLQAALRRQYPDLSLTVTSAGNLPLLQYAAAGKATAELDTKDEEVQRYRSFLAGNQNQGIPDHLAESRSFAKYIYSWGEEYFIVYVIALGFSAIQYILKEPGEGETIMSTNLVTDRLLWAIGQWNNDNKYIYVYDGYWTTSKDLYDEVQKASWKDVILDENMKHTLTDLTHKFFDSKDIYRDLGVPWKRGVIFYGPAGNGKTISIKAMMHSLFERSGFSIPSLYVKSASRTWDIGNVFRLARQMSPCLLIFEDIDTIVTPTSRSYFFNEVDGLQNNDGIFMVASTNHLDELDPGLSSRPSRFDRKYEFPLPSLHERILYCQYWKHKLQDKPSIEFPQELCPAIAEITEDFSFAYLKEAFVATLLVIAGRRSDHGTNIGVERGNLDRFELWREIKRQVKMLRDDMETHLCTGEFDSYSKRSNPIPWTADSSEGPVKTPMLEDRHFHRHDCPPTFNDTHLPLRFREDSSFGSMPHQFLQNLTIQPPSTNNMA